MSHFHRPGLVIRAYREADEAAVIALWESCDLTRPWNPPGCDIARKRDVQPELFLLAEAPGPTEAWPHAVIGSVMAGYDGHRGWLNYLAVHPTRQRQGLGRLLVQAAEAALDRLGCPKVNLQVRQTNAEAVAFYQRIGYQVDPVISLGKRLTRADEPEP